MTARPARLLALLLLALAVACGGGDDGADPFDPGDPNGDPDPPGDTTTTTPSDKPASLPTFGSLFLYNFNSPWNQPIPFNVATDPGSAAMIAKLVSSGSFYISVKTYSSTIFFADASTPRVDVALPCGQEWELGVSTLSGVPIPDHAEPAKDTPDTPQGCGEASDADNHMVVFDLATRCEYDFWQMRKVGSGWEASWGNSISMDGDGIYAHGLSTRGSGFAFPGGVLWPDELASGQISHALAFNSPFTRSGGPVAPATDSDGITDGNDAIPEGALLQLDPSFDISGLSGYERAVAQALQTYGMYLVDTGGAEDSGVGLYAVDPKSTSTNPYAGVLPDTEWASLDNIPLDRFRVVRMGPQDGAWEDNLDLVASGCGTLR